MVVLILIENLARGEEFNGNSSEKLNMPKFIDRYPDRNKNRQYIIE
jgi:hypothetical protein